MKRFFSKVVIFLLLNCALALNAAAYLDPSAMTYTLQIVFMIIIAGGAAIGIYWKKIRLFFKNRRSKQGAAATSAEANPEKTQQLQSSEDDIFEPSVEELPFDKPDKK